MQQGWDAVGPRMNPAGDRDNPAPRGDEWVGVASLCGMKLLIPWR